MNHLGDANTLVIIMGLISLGLTGTALATWQERRYSPPRYLVFALGFSQLVWSGWLLYTLIQMYVKTRHLPQYPFGFGPTPGQKHLALALGGALIACIVVTILSLAAVLRRYNRSVTPYSSH